MRKVYLIVLLFIPVMSIAQTNYKSGYVVTLKGDTLHGYINYKEWGHNPSDISFKTTFSDNAKELGTSDISYFEISNYVSYHAYTVSISSNTVDISSPPATIDTAVTTADVFLKVLEKGKYLTLYSYKDGLKERFYIQEKDMMTPEELFYGIYKDSNSAANIVYKNTYQGQLNQLVIRYQPNNDKLIIQVQESDYKDYVLIPIVAQINGSANEETAAKSGKHNPSVRFFVGASFISSTLKFSNIATEDHYYGYSSSTSNSPKISIGIDAIPNPDVGHLIFRLELGYTQDKFSFAEQANPIFNDANPILNSEIDKMNVIFITPQVIYNIFNEAKLKLFVDAGYSINLLSYPNTTIVTTRSGETLYTTTTQGFDANQTNSSVFTLKAGAVVNKRFELYAEYFFAGQVTNSFAYDTNLTSYQIGVNYFIGKVAH